MKKPKMVKKDGPEIPLTAEERAWNEHHKKLVAKWEQQRKQVAGHWPTVPELAQLAALIAQGQQPVDGKALARTASAVWQSCRDQLEWEIRDYIKEIENHWNTGFEPEWVRKEWEAEEAARLKFRRGTEKLDAVLESLMGKKTRLGERYRIFREFLRDMVKKQRRLRDSRKIAEMAEAKFVELRRTGFTEHAYHETDALFAEWRAEKRRVRSKKAAGKRWAVEKKK